MTAPVPSRRYRLRELLADPKLSIALEAVDGIHWRSSLFGRSDFTGDSRPRRPRIWYDVPHRPERTFLHYRMENQTMVRAPASTADRLSTLIAEIEAEAYSRGQADARTELLNLLGAGTWQRAGAKTSGRGSAKSAPARKRRSSGRKRAPKGSVPRFVEQALRDRPGQTPQEILARAADDMERLIKLPSVRTELRNGGKRGKYEQNGGRWFLAGTDAGAGEASTSEAPPDAETRGLVSADGAETPSAEPSSDSGPGAGAATDDAPR